RRRAQLSVREGNEKRLGKVLKQKKRRDRKEKHKTSMAAEEGSSGGGGGGDMKGSPAPTKAAGSGAAKFLSGMPSRGNFSSGSVSSSLGGFRVYVCEHSTDPPEGQVIKTDSTNILIRHLQLKNQKSEAKNAGNLLSEVWMSTIQQRGLTWVLRLEPQAMHKQFLAFHNTPCNHLQLRGYVFFYDKVVSQPKGKRMN
ncbi:hypothetical protein EJB05_50656, partial [Eragrostis curvula]